MFVLFLTKNKRPLEFWQKPSTRSYTKKAEQSLHSPALFILKSILITSCYLHLLASSRISPSGFPNIFLQRHFLSFHYPNKSRRSVLGINFVRIELFLSDFFRPYFSKYSFQILSNRCETSFHSQTLPAVCPECGNLKDFNQDSHTTDRYFNAKASEYDTLRQTSQAVNSAARSK
jgi:hypothetical protein